MRKLYSATERARALDEIAFQASLHALLTAVGQLESIPETPVTQAAVLQPVPTAEGNAR